jgi:hypothetical protein
LGGRSLRGYVQKVVVCRSGAGTFRGEGSAGSVGFVAEFMGATGSRDNRT